MNIHQVSSLSGLTRGQISQLISRYGFTPHGAPNVGNARQFTKGDVFNLVVAGKLTAFGIDQPTVVALLSSMPFPEVDRSTFEQLEVFPGRKTFSERKQIAFLLVWGDAATGYESEFLTHTAMRLRLSRTPTAFVLNATEIANAIDQAAADSGEPA